ncbi:methyltransferase [Nocardioides phosphati]|uniref:Methyltransferase n=1 Tax=Nocardioides phosphati TaxID=1867775 RepID=A0ABQ2N8T7_9ACTN|nr:class I SAM-dependent methyltransferase [Nocardioides phosphati]GGO88758.1 methyltransferase [Nocardioides phosphati]
MSRARIASAYDARADEYVEKMGALHQMAAQDRATIRDWRDATAGRLLDAGCGPGHWTDVLADDGRREALGLDGSAGFLASARRRFPAQAFLAGDLAALPLAPGAVGGVLAWYSIIHTAPAGLPAVLGELARVLTPGGSLLLGFFDGEPGLPFDHAVTTAYFWSAEALTDLLRPHGFVVERSASRHDPGVRRRHGELLATRSATSAPPGRH